MKTLSKQKIYLLSVLIFFSFFLNINNVLAACPTGFIKPIDYDSLPSNSKACTRISTLPTEQQEAVQAQNTAYPDCSSQDPDVVGPPDSNCQIFNQRLNEEIAEQQATIQATIKEQQEKINACQSAHSSAWQSTCNASQFSPAIIAALQAFKSSEATGDIQAICQRNKELNKWALGINTTTLGLCLVALKKCTSACSAAAPFDPNAQYLADECASKRNWTLVIGGPSVITNLVQVINSADCPDQNAGGGTCGEISQRRQDCVANSGASGSSCAQVNRELTECITGAQQPEAPCTGLAGDRLMECLGVEPTNFPPGQELPGSPDFNPRRNKALSTASLSNPTFDPSDHEDEEDLLLTPPGYTGNGDSGNPSSPSLASTPGGGGGGGFGGGGGGFGGAGGEEEEGGDEGPYEENVDPGIDTAILGDVGSSRGASSGFGGSGYQGKNKGTGLRKNLNSFALPKNLFDKKANKTGRNIAGVGGADEITSANGLSNFQKVSRAMNDRRQNVFK